MHSQRKHIVIFEHESLKLNASYNDVEFDENCLKVLQNYHGEKGVPYFSLINNGVKFNEYVGVIQVGKVIIEVLPKADKDSNNKEHWRNILIEMIRATGSIKINQTSTSYLKISRNSILDLYFELFVNEVEGIIRKGLIKNYRKKEDNIYTLKGKLKISKNIKKNFIRQERFYVNYTVFDYEHKIHQIIYKTILLLIRINTNSHLNSRIENLILNFPEMPDIAVDEKTFNSIEYNRKNHFYKASLEIARLLLLHYHPDISKGHNNVLAIMFNMNNLWEKFVLNSLRKYSDFSITAQSSKEFWESEHRVKVRVKPDIQIVYKNNNYVLDTKWKRIVGSKPSVEDLRQMFVYHEYFDARKVSIIYPSDINTSYYGTYKETPSMSNSIKSNKECRVLFVPINQNIRVWQNEIKNLILDWIDN